MLCFFASSLFRCALFFAFSVIYQLEDQDSRTNFLEERGYDMNPTTMSYKHQGSKKPLMIQINPNHKDDFNKIHGLIFFISLCFS